MPLTCESLPEFLTYDGKRRRVVRWEGEFIINGTCETRRHMLWIMWDDPEWSGRGKFQGFTSDPDGNFPELIED